MDEAQIRAIINEEVRGIINATDREKDPFAGQNAFAGGVSLDITSWNCVKSVLYLATIKAILSPLLI